MLLKQTIIVTVCICEISLFAICVQYFQCIFKGYEQLTGKFIWWYIYLSSDHRDLVRCPGTRISTAVVLAMCWGNEMYFVVIKMIWQTLFANFLLLFFHWGCKWLWFGTCCLWIFYTSLYSIWRRNFCKYPLLVLYFPF